MEEKLISSIECLELDAKYGQDLYFYLTLKKEDKEKDLIRHGLWLFANYVQKYYFGDDKTKILSDIRRKFVEDKTTLITDIIDGVYKKFCDKFTTYLFGEYRSVERFSNAPGWMCYDKPKVVKNRWILYDKDAIFTWSGNITEKYDGKYVFGYLAHDIDTLYPMQEEGKMFSLCRGNGVKALNIKTKKYYVMFWKETAKDFINVLYSNNKWHVYDKENEEVIFSCEKLSDISDWIKKYDNPYREVYLDFLKDKAKKNNICDHE